MVEGDKWELYIPSDLAYGDPMAGSDPTKKKQAQQAVSDLQLQRDAEVATKTKELREEINKLSSMQRGSGTGGMPEGFSRVGER